MRAPADQRDRGPLAQRAPQGVGVLGVEGLGILEGGNSGFNPVVTATGGGCTDYYAQVDGVTSSTSSICFH